MLKEAIEKLVSLKDNKTYDKEGPFYSDRELVLMEPPEHRPRMITVNSLDGIVSLITQEIESDAFKLPIYIDVTKHDTVRVFTTFGEKNKRDSLYEAISDTPRFDFGWKDYESAIISFRSQFKLTEDVEYILNLLSKISDENSIESADNGLSQSVEVRKGISLKANETVKPIVSLTPFRTFLEVEQPESQFLLRVREGGDIGLIEADGGMWRLTAKQTIKDYFKEKLEQLIADGTVIVIG